MEVLYSAAAMNRNLPRYFFPFPIFQLDRAFKRLAARLLEPLPGLISIQFDSNQPHQGGVDAKSVWGVTFWLWISCCAR